MSSPARRQGAPSCPRTLPPELVMARAVFGVEYAIALEKTNLKFPSWLSEFASSYEFRRARKAAGLPKDLDRELLIFSLALHTLMNRARPPTNKEVSKAFDIAYAAIRKARALLSAPNFSYDIEERLPAELSETVGDDGEIEFVSHPTCIEVTRYQLDGLLEGWQMIRLPPPARRGPKIAHVTSAVVGLVNTVLDRHPEIDRLALVTLIRKVLEPALTKSKSPDALGVDWYGQVRQAVRERNELNRCGG